MADGPLGFAGGSAHYRGGYFTAPLRDIGDHVDTVFDLPLNSIDLITDYEHGRHQSNQQDEHNPHEDYRDYIERFLKSGHTKLLVMRRLYVRIHYLIYKIFHLPSILTAVLA